MQGQTQVFQLLMQWWSVDLFMHFPSRAFVWFVSLPPGSVFYATSVSYATSVAHSSWPFHFAWQVAEIRMFSREFAGFGWGLSSAGLMVDVICWGASYIFQAGPEETEQSLRIYPLADDCFSCSACEDVLSYSFSGGEVEGLWSSIPAGCSCCLDCTYNFHGIPPWWIFFSVAFLLVHLRTALNCLTTQ